MFSVELFQNGSQRSSCAARFAIIRTPQPTMLDNLCSCIDLQWRGGAILKIHVRGRHTQWLEAKPSILVSAVSGDIRFKRFSEKCYYNNVSVYV